MIIDPVHMAEYSTLYSICTENLFKPVFAVTGVLSVSHSVEGDPYCYTCVYDRLKKEFFIMFELFCSLL